MTKVEPRKREEEMLRDSYCFRLSIACFSLFSLASAGESGEVEWGKFQNGGRPVADAEGLPTTWSENKNLAWAAEIHGYGQSTPIIAGGQIYVTSVSGEQKDRFHLSAYSIDSGEKQWQLDFVNPSPKENTPMTSRAAPTPVADKDGCVAFFEGGIVVAVDRDGVIRWRRNLIEDYGPAVARHGLASSLEQDERCVFVWVERSDDPYILALDKRTGEDAWKVAGAGATSWASPRLIPTDWGEQLVCSASGKILGIDPESGDRLWTFTDIANNASCTPIPVAKNRFLIGASDGRGEENAGTGAAFNGVIEIAKEGDRFVASYLWNAEKASCTFGSPVVADGSACIVNRAGVLYRLNIETGAQMSVNRTSAGGIWATPIVAGDRLYLFGYKGTTSVISLADGEELSENRLWSAPADGAPFGGGNVLYAAAPASPYLILRRGDMLYAVKEAN
jgi:outer membrane protein assembly factor BamB